MVGRSTVQWNEEGLDYGYLLELCPVTNNCTKDATKCNKDLRCEKCDRTSHYSTDAKW
jgi:hypothetical protein